MSRSKEARIQININVNSEKFIWTSRASSVSKLENYFSSVMLGFKGTLYNINKNCWSTRIENKLIDHLAVCYGGFRHIWKTSRTMSQRLRI